VKTTVLLLCACILASSALFAQTAADARVLFDPTMHGPHVVHMKEKAAIHVPAQEPPKGLKTIYNNLSKGEYNDTSTVIVAGPDSILGEAIFIAIPFIPKADSHVTQVGAAVQYGGSGANQVNLSIYSDNNFTPGTLLAGPVTVTNLPNLGTCCTLAVADFTPLAVTAETRYWVVADTPLSGTGSDFLGGWDSEIKPILPLAVNVDAGEWSSANGNGLPAGEVLGTIP